MPETPLRPADHDQAERLHTFAHDIKNRLGGLWEVLRMLHNGPAEGMDRAELMAFAERGFFHAQRDLETLLDDFGVERGVTADRLPFDLAKALGEAINKEDYRLRKKGQEVRVSAPAQAQVLGDARWTTQIIQALISNASKFSERGAQVTAEIMRAQDGWTLRISDQGCGLTAEDLAGIFKRYGILSSRSTEGEPQSRGTLGRAVQWATAQGGTLTAESAGTAQGSIFSLVLPAAS